MIAAIAQEDEDGANWDPRVALQSGDYGEDGSAVLGVATLRFADMLGLDAAVRRTPLSTHLHPLISHVCCQKTVWKG